MCNRVSAPEFREIKIRWNLFNDLPEFKPSHNIAPDRGDILTVVRSDAGNAGRLMYWPLIPSFAKTMNLEYSTSNATADATTGGHLAICKISQVLALKTDRQVLSKAKTRH
jgi:putative SOS response-associated peptidase YedK